MPARQPFVARRVERCSHIRTTGLIAPFVLDSPINRDAFAPGEARRPTVLLLHGAKGLKAQAPAYDRYARDLAAAGLDTWLFSYYRVGEAAAIRRAGSAAGREVLYARFVDGWVSLIHEVAALALKQERSSAGVGLLGFSLGGMVGVAAANRSIFSALGILYGAAPDFYRPRLSALPPIIDLHGSADKAVPLALGEQLVATAKQIGGKAELVVYQGQVHGFDLDLTNPYSQPARMRAVPFLKDVLTQVL